jgi:hypothetical protein
MKIQIAISRALLGLFAIGFLCASSGLVSAKDEDKGKTSSPARVRSGVSVDLRTQTEYGSLNKKPKTDGSRPCFLGSRRYC